MIEIDVSERLPFLRMPDPSLGTLLACYAAAICFTMSLLAFSSLSDGAEPFLLPFRRLIRWLGSLTFALYLFHAPLLAFFNVYSPFDRSSGAEFILLFGGTLLVVATLGSFCERSKGAYKRLFLSIPIERLLRRDRVMALAATSVPAASSPEATLPEQSAGSTLGAGASWKAITKGRP
ncbi:MAG TPA: hypothetical protein VFW75_05425 [Acetobacteraceae bacterium]|nr:hypothetical protein [Acetobacteraceae bacterium]